MKLVGDSTSLQKCISPPNFEKFYVVYVDSKQKNMNKVHQVIFLWPDLKAFSVLHDMAYWTV